MTDPDPTPSAPVPDLRDAVAQNDWPRVQRLVDGTWPTLVREHPDELREAMDTLIARVAAPSGEAPVAPSAAPSAAPSGEADAAMLRSLSPRERVVLAELASGDSVADIAARLFVSPNTVKTQLRSAYRKLGVSTRAAAERAAARFGLTI